tara:strand:- start:1329 stop:1583 length:255 start_codon:yes stop_codon:yes gene_type:complete
MSKSRFVLNKIAKLIEEGLVNYKDFTNEIINILKSKRDEIVFRLKITSKEETDILTKRIEIIEKKLEDLKKVKKKHKSRKAKRS